ncbi:glycosyltransferase family 2 protein [Nitrospirillum iridis]|uniref:Glycosyl transferase family 2 n=1 Tax=Nitrospirillum iridis TaxID=765888 RepID=A0A7X0AWP5_9PROT|nr:glycosyltransferase family 2 protein [Nitrospirillum iridis]MBB6251483.1 hypothetical protein [Nitrospirillum iridis]
MKLHAILITRNDDLIIENWLARHHDMFDTIAVVDGSDGDFTRVTCARYPHIRYSTDPAGGPITDQTLRHRGYELLRDTVTEGDWIFNAHADEFLIHDPRNLMTLPWNTLLWLPLHILPHPSEAEAWRATGGRHPTMLFRHFWWRRGRPPHCEFRMWRVVREPIWDLVGTKPSTDVIPMNYLGEGAPSIAPLYFHYKCYDPRPELYETDGRLKKSNLNTGIPTRALPVEDYFFDEDRPYVEDGVAWHVARFDSMADLLARFGHPPQIIRDERGEVRIVNDDGVPCH